MKKVQAKPTITFVGAGALAAGMTRALRAHGYSISEIAVRAAKPSAKRVATEAEANLVKLQSAAISADLIWLAVSDDAIASCAALLAPKRDWRGKVVLHSSGALSSAVLEPLRKSGAAIGSLHPMMTFVSASTAPGFDALRGVCFAAEGEPLAVRVASAIARELGGEVLKLSAARKAAYHAFGAFLSPLVVAELTAAEEVAKLAGINKAQAQRIMQPIVQRTVSNYLQNGAQKSFSGPLVRGDVETVRRHLQALTGDVRDVYVSLATLATSKLKVKNRKQLLHALSASTAIK